LRVNSLINASVSQVYVVGCHQQMTGLHVSFTKCDNW